MHRDLLERALPAHAARGRRVERARRRVTRQRPGYLYRVGRQVLGEPGRPRPVDQALAPQEPERELLVVPGVRIVTASGAPSTRISSGSSIATSWTPRCAPPGGSGSWAEPFEQRARILRAASAPPSRTRAPLATNNAPRSRARTAPHRPGAPHPAGPSPRPARGRRPPPARGSPGAARDRVAERGIGDLHLQQTVEVADHARPRIVDRQRGTVRCRSRSRRPTRG